MKRNVAETETPATDVEDLRAFCRVADLGSITAAARMLGETKGSISRRLTRLERALGVVLLRRSPRLVETTEDGAAYRLRVGRVLELLDEANAQAQHARSHPTGHLRVTAATDVGLVLCAPLVAGFVEKYPDVSVELVLTEATLDFDAHHIDVALRAGPGLRDSALVAHKVQDLQTRLYASPAYLKKSPPAQKPEDLAQHRLVLSQTTRGDATLALRHVETDKRCQVRVHAAIASTDFTFSREAALAGGGIAHLPDFVAKRDLAAGKLVPVLKDYVCFSAAIYMVHHGTRYLPPKVRAFRDYVLESIGQRGYPRSLAGRGDRARST